ncbi:hypothetical protein BJ085DRAFT_37529 [Dimargaris cristalligena]|uniref:Uncharacterized protein n=1 Tax=Dimargaris cristalligena TaxID=215637 RepID=A0A4P9ZSY8_9FUNG|nr:hypothetical protein BJ085DRAFT_37529 [Dimargaris cristalligena]|eukprot:RKP36545.1 hypothetical protein BJ085DRAFT_37529 [Dimargaris cristalligena]
MTRQGHLVHILSHEFLGTESDYRHKDERTLSNSYLADEMRKLDLVKKLDADTRSKLTDLGFWKHDDIWEYGQLFADRFPDVNLS